MSLVSARNLGDNLPAIVGELQGLTISLVVGEAADTEIAVEGLENEDTILKVINLTDLTEINPATVSIGDRRATALLAIYSGLVDGDSFILNGKTYTFTQMRESITTNVGPNIIPIEVGVSGVDGDAVAARLAKVLMSSDSALTAVATDDPGVLVTWREPGEVGNAVALDFTGSGGGNIGGPSTFSGGSDANGLKISTSTASKKLLVFWYDKNRPA